MNSGTKVQSLEEENKNLKLKIIELTQELEKKETSENKCFEKCLERQADQTPEKSVNCNNRSVMPMSSQGANSPLVDFRVQEEVVDEFIRKNLQSYKQSVDEEIDRSSPQRTFKFRIKLCSADPFSDTESDSSGTDCDWAEGGLTTVTTDKKNSRGRPKKKLKVVSEVEVCSDEEMVGVREGIDPLCVGESNPPKAEKILEFMSPYLGKHDMLNARLVSHAWNDETLKVLQKSKFTQVLREWNIEEYKFFTTTRLLKPHQFIIPFHLNFSIDLSSMSFDMNNPSVLTSHVKYLCQTFGQHCVSTLTLSCDMDYAEEDIKEIDLVECFKVISPGLKTLDLTHSDFRNNFLKYSTTDFPCLKKLICNTRHFEAGRSGPTLAYISIIENSPELEDLTLTHPCDLESWPLKFNQLKSLSLDTRIMNNPKNILDKILECSGPPVLRELVLNFVVSGDTVDYVVVHNILQSLSPTLKSLRLLGPTHSYYFLHNCGNPRSMIFPILPNLEHLKLEYNLGYQYWIIPESMNLRQETFPSLKCIELPIGFIFTPSFLLIQECQADDDRRFEFPNLTELILRVNAIGGHSPDDLDGGLEHLQKIFPTPTELSFVNVGGHGFVTSLLHRIMRSNWYKNIQEIGMIGFRENYLGQVLYTYCKMTNITTIKLEFIEAIDGFYYDQQGSRSLCTASIPIPNLTGFVKNCPQLRKIEVSGPWFHQTDRIMLKKHSDEFKSKFLDIILHIT